MSHRSATDPLLDISDLTVEYGRGRRSSTFRAVDSVDLTVLPNETVGLVGESGSGKSTIGKAILGLVPVQSGTVRFAGLDLLDYSRRRKASLASRLQVVFQDPYSSLNPARTVGQSLTEVLRPHKSVGRREASKRALAMLDQVGIPGDAANRYPGQFSGGQLQRIAIARALMPNPEMLICDEAVSALDLSVQAQVLNLFADLQERLGLSYLFISHDLSVVRHVSQKIVVLYKGRVMEQGVAASVCAAPKHPYTRALLEAEPVPDPETQRRRRELRDSQAASTVESLGDFGCPFAQRCPYVVSVCLSERPRLETAEDGVQVACHRWGELASDDSAGSSESGGAVSLGHRDVIGNTSGEPTIEHRGVREVDIGAVSLGRSSSSEASPRMLPRLSLRTGEVADAAE